MLPYEGVEGPVVGLTARTEINQMAYWRDRYNDEFKETGDRLKAVLPRAEAHAA